MAVEGTYEDECMRAELLGIDKPDYEEFMKNKAEREEAERLQNEADTLKEIYTEDEEIKRVGGKLDELNNILRSTQKRINNFASPFSNYFKSKIMGVSLPTEEKEEENEEETLIPFVMKPPGAATTSTAKPGEKPIDFLDELIEKYDKSQLGMESQNKQIKSDEDDDEEQLLDPNTIFINRLHPRERSGDSDDTSESEMISDIGESSEEEFDREDEDIKYDENFKYEQGRVQPDIDDIGDILQTKEGNRLGKLYNEKLIKTLNM